jgi:hypothetical protein
MIGLINFLRKRPSDATIRIWRIIFGLLLILGWYYNLIYQWDELQSSILWRDLSQNWVIYVKYIIMALWIIPLFMWISNCCLFKKKYIKIVQIIFGIILFYISSIIIEWPDLDFDSLLAFMWIFPLIWWITWKCITTKCLKYKEKIHKIRV